MGVDSKDTFWAQYEANGWSFEFSIDRFIAEIRVGKAFEGVSCQPLSPSITHLCDCQYCINSLFLVVSCLIFVSEIETEKKINQEERKWITPSSRLASSSIPSTVFECQHELIKSITVFLPTKSQAIHFIANFQMFLSRICLFMVVQYWIQICQFTQ